MGCWFHNLWTMEFDGSIVWLSMKIKFFPVILGPGGLQPDSVKDPPSGKVGENCALTWFVSPPLGRVPSLVVSSQCARNQRPGQNSRRSFPSFSVLLLCSGKGGRGNNALSMSTCTSRRMQSAGYGIWVVHG
eukprot:CAMPEP_0174363932 /NCGR_PEP_ID=MMETSP0811_2-20130205/70827_1 /TAXON_ID=73025 ORGANISM="Eutreptiella gymnastica-like, Strain CCMP1594" /NCGR_SAMPLE_ID=MMETSP0811_2 /ASSEMBLY_ACC=CAM_ASM_000667 /LENGTH=131 /DNA_ID=CAMNT_0015503085 /DNA_START=488 /DNA_END=883 /DNA_ORIENTATION=-